MFCCRGTKDEQSKIKGSRSAMHKKNIPMLPLGLRYHKRLPYYIKKRKGLNMNSKDEEKHITEREITKASREANIWRKEG
jgi:hypothetical protein